MQPIVIYERVHEIEFELSDKQHQVMQRAFGVVRQECGQALTDDECLIAIFERAAGSV